MNNPPKRLSLLTRLLYRWIIPTVYLARKRQLRETDLENLPFCSASAGDAIKFEAIRVSQFAGSPRSLMLQHCGDFSWRHTASFCHFDAASVLEPRRPSAAAKLTSRTRWL
jgi:hypothetical protein